MITWGHDRSIKWNEIHSILRVNWIAHTGASPTYVYSHVTRFLLCCVILYKAKVRMISVRVIKMVLVLGSIKIIDWCNAVETVLKLGLPWRTLRRRLVQSSPLNHHLVLYNTSFEELSSTEASPTRTVRSGMGKYLPKTWKYRNNVFQWSSFYFISLFILYSGSCDGSGSIYGLSDSWRGYHTILIKSGLKLDDFAMFFFLTSSYYHIVINTIRTTPVLAKRRGAACRR